MSPRDRTLRLLLALALLAGGCARESGGRSALAEVGDSVDFQYQPSHELAIVEPGTVVYLTVDQLKVKRDIRVERARPDRLDPGLEVLEARISYMNRARDGHGVNGNPGSGCTKRWPPKGFGPSIPAHAPRLQAGDDVFVTFFVRVRTRGEFSAEGLELVYSEAAHQASLQKSHASRLTVETGRDDAALPCSDKTLWLGDDDVDEPFRVRGRIDAALA